MQYDGGRGTHVPKAQRELLMFTARVDTEPPTAGSPRTWTMFVCYLSAAQETANAHEHGDGGVAAHSQPSEWAASGWVLETGKLTKRSVPAAYAHRAQFIFMQHTSNQYAHCPHGHARGMILQPLTGVHTLSSGADAAIQTTPGDARPLP